MLNNSNIDDETCENSIGVQGMLAMGGEQGEQAGPSLVSKEDETCLDTILEVELNNLGVIIYSG